MKKFKILKFEVDVDHGTSYYGDGQITDADMRMFVEDITVDNLVELISHISENDKSTLASKLGLYKKEAINLIDVNVIGDDFYIGDGHNIKL